MKSLKQKIDHIISCCESGMPRRELLLAMERLDKAKCEYEAISNPEILGEKIHINEIFALSYQTGDISPTNQIIL